MTSASKESLPLNAFSTVIKELNIKMICLKVSIRAKTLMQKLNNGNILFIFIESCYKTVKTVSTVLS